VESACPDKPCLSVDKRQFKPAMLMMKRQLEFEWTTQCKYSIFIGIRPIKCGDGFFEKDAAFFHFS